MFSNTLNENFLSVVLLAIAVIAVIYVFLNLKNRTENFPPGPLGLPVVGYLPFLSKKPYLVFAGLSRKYGPVFSLRLGSKDVVVLNNAKTVKEAFSKPELNGRPEVSVFSTVDIVNPFFESGWLWQEQRRFAVHSLKELGLGKSIMHDHVVNEIQHFIEAIEKTKGKSVLVKKHLTPSMSNNICSLLFGHRYDYDDPSRKRLDESLERGSKFLAQTAFQLFLPWVESVPILNRILKAEEQKREFLISRPHFQKEISDHKESLDPQNPKDYIDMFLLEMKNRSKEKDSTFNEKVLEGCAINIFGAGSETVQTTISWCLYVVAAYPEIQVKVQAEIDNIIGRERTPHFSDQKKMLYTQSILLEIQRHYTVVPINLLRCTLEDTIIAGYNVPKDTYVIANFWAVHHDPDCWKNPYEFIPERFLSKDGKTVVKSDAYMPFSYGKRDCPGKSFAQLQVFLYFTAILQKFTLKFPDDQIIDFEGELGITYHVKPYKMCFLTRN